MRANTRNYFDEPDDGDDGSAPGETAGRRTSSARFPAAPEGKDTSITGSKSSCGIPLLIFGAVWLAETAGLIQGVYFWPLAVAGAWLLTTGSACGVPMAVIGSLWLLQTIGLFEQAHFWPIVVISVGIWWTAAQFHDRRGRQRDSRRL